MAEEVTKQEFLAAWRDEGWKAAAQFWVDNGVDFQGMSYEMVAKGAFDAIASKLMEGLEERICEKCGFTEAFRLTLPDKEQG